MSRGRHQRPWLARFQRPWRALGWHGNVLRLDHAVCAVVAWTCPHRHATCAHCAATSWSPSWCQILLKGFPCAHVNAGFMCQLMDPLDARFARLRPVSWLAISGMFVPREGRFMRARTAARAAPHHRAPRGARSPHTPHTPHGVISLRGFSCTPICTRAALSRSTGNSQGHGYSRLARAFSPSLTVP